MSGLFPLPIYSERLVLSSPVATPEKIQKYLDAVRISLPVLKPWVLWAYGIFNEQTAKGYLEACQYNWVYQSNNDIGLVLWIETLEGDFVGNIIIWNIDWQIPKFEIGYWVNQAQAGKGYISEGVNATTRYLFQQLKASRVEIRSEKKNYRSAAVPLRIGFVKEGSLKNGTRNIASGHLMEVDIFGCIDYTNLIPLKVRW